MLLAEKGVQGYEQVPVNVLKGEPRERSMLGELMRIKGEAVSIADLHLAPILAYVVLTPHRDELLALPGLGDWWTRITARDSFKSTAP